MGFFDTLTTVAKGTLKSVDRAATSMARKLSDTALLDKMIEHPNNKYFQAEAERRGRGL
jgi:hypothetical protein